MAGAHGGFLRRRFSRSSAGSRKALWLFTRQIFRWRLEGVQEGQGARNAARRE